MVGKSEGFEWGLYESNGKKLPPLQFSNGKTQEDVVTEVVSALQKGANVVFIKGMCGTGKSAIALHLVRELGKGSIVVPVKNLQKQYQRDYLEKKYIQNKETRLKIAVMFGRRNFPCQYLKDKNTPKTTFDNPLLQFDTKGRITSKPKNASLDIFDNMQKHEELPKEASAEHFLLPCTIELKERHRELLKEYISENPLIKKDSFESVDELNRLSVAAACPYWSPILPAVVDVKALSDAKKVTYPGLQSEYCIYKRKPGCPYYEQFISYKEADAIVFNSHKYLIEHALGRKPRTDIEIIDECDEFLDSFSNEENVNLNRFLSSLTALHAIQIREDKEKAEVTKKMGKLVMELLSNQQQGISPLKDSAFSEIISLFSKNWEMFEELDEEHNYLIHCFKVAKVFEHLEDQAFYAYRKAGRDGKEIAITIVTIDLATMFADIIEKNKSLILMSGTLHTEQVLKDVFGLKDFSIIDAETQMQGRVDIIRTGKEIDCKYENFRNGSHTREEYLIALDRCVQIAHRPTLIHVNGFLDLPNETEKELYHLKHLQTQEEIKQEQEHFKEDELVQDFKKGKRTVLFSTRCNRGVDFPDEECRSIIITKYPYPDVKSLFWEILKRKKPEYYWELYMDKAHRELLQRVYRGIRSKNDWVQLLSPDIRVLNNFSTLIVKEKSI